MKKIVLPKNDAEIGLTQIGGFRLLERVGVGGMGVVYRAQNLQSARILRAIKVIRPELAAQGDFRQRFLREAEFLELLEHPNILRVHHIGDENGVLFLVMELLIGKSFEQLIVEQPAQLAIGVIANLLHQALVGVGHAHREGVIHRDLKPANLFLTQGDKVKVLDFGIARHGDGNQTKLTSANQGMPGSPAYYAPEFADGQAATPASDVYAMGISLFELITGQLPFKAGGGTDAQATMSLLNQHINKPLPDVKTYRPEISDGLVDVLRKATAKKPSERFPNAEVFAAALLPFVSSNLGGLVGAPRGSQEGIPTLSGTPPEYASNTPASKERKISQNMPVGQTRFDLAGADASSVSAASATRFELPPMTTLKPQQESQQSRSAIKPIYIAFGVGLAAVGLVSFVTLGFRAKPAAIATTPYSSVSFASSASLQPSSQVPSQTAFRAPDGMVVISGGKLSQGRAPYGEENAYDVPEHEVDVATFAIEKTEVAISAYKEFVDDGHATAPWSSRIKNLTPLLNQAVLNVSYRDAQNYCLWRYPPDGRLPTESEWEWAARGPKNLLYPWGNDFQEVCVNGMKGEDGVVMAVDKHRCGNTEAGIMNMSGNVWEWTSSEPSLYPGAQGVKLPERPNLHVIRGGSYFNSHQNELTATIRAFLAVPNTYTGFRCAFGPSPNKLNVNKQTQSNQKSSAP